MKSYIFNRKYVVKDAEGRLYEKGEVVELSEASARHFARKKLITLVGADFADEKPAEDTDADPAGDEAPAEEPEKKGASVALKKAFARKSKKK